MAFLGRLIVVSFAVVLASLAASMVIAAGLLGPDWHAFSGDFAERTGYWLLVVFATGFTGAFGLLPLVILIVLAESFKIRSLLVHAAVGALLLASGYYASGPWNRYEESIDRAPPPISRAVEIAAAGGVMFGLVYWTIAGRKAGRWREPRGV